MKKYCRMIAMLISVVILVSCLGGIGFVSAEAEAEYVSAQLPGFESLSAVQLALVWHENINRVRSSTAVHPEGSAKSLEVTLGKDADDNTYDTFSFASVTAADKSISEFALNAHEFPRSGNAFGDVSLVDSERISLWLGNYPANGKVKIRLLTAPSRGPLSDNEAFADYPVGFIFESPEVTPVDGVATFDFADFVPAADWSEGSLFSHLSEINAICVTLIPGEGNCEYNTKYYVGDIRIWKRKTDISWNGTGDAVNGVFDFTVRSASAEAEVAVKLCGEELLQTGEPYLNAYGETCRDYSVDSTAYPDGLQTFEFYKDGEPAFSSGVFFDNAAPFVNVFGSEPNYGVKAGESGGELNIAAYADTDANYTFYQADMLPVTVTENFSTLNDMKQRNPQGETELDFESDVLYSTVSQTTSIPYQAFEIDAAGKTETVYFTYKGSTIKNESLILEVFNTQTETWDTLAHGDKSGKENEFTCAVEPEYYADANGKIKVRVSEYLYGNGSDSFAWTTDTQYYIGNSSYRHYMIEQFNWFVTEYNAGNIAYVCNTGDVVNTKSSINEYETGRNVHNILDNNNVPNGVTPGNHDIGNAHDETLYYDNWNTYFGAQYYDYQPWWGGGYLSNTSHYDLMTIGGRDFIFLYLGLNHETTDDGVAWANKVLKMYPHRTAVILTHQFLSTSGSLLTGSYGFADQILDKIVEPNPNVRMVLCGHEPASHNLYRKMKNGVTIVELIHDYQFTYKDAGDGTWVTTWGTTDGGMGYFRYMDVGDNTITSRCYSASRPDVDHYYPSEAGIVENYTMNLEYVQSDRRVNTSYFSATCGSERLGDYVAGANGEIWTLPYNGPADGSRCWYAVMEKNGVYTRSGIYPIDGRKLVILRGDFDDDGVITVSDALAALRIAAKLVAETEDTLAVGDMDGDGEITVADALKILRISVGLL